MVVLYVQPVYDVCSVLFNFFKGFGVEMFPSIQCVGRGVVSMLDCGLEMFLGPRLPAVNRGSIDGIFFQYWMYWVVCGFLSGHIGPMYTGGYLHQFLESWDAVARCGELLVVCNLLCCCGCGGCGMVCIL